MRLSYIPILLLLFLSCSVYAINQDGFEFTPIDTKPINNIDPGTGSIPPSNTQNSFIPQMPADFTNILAAGMIGITIGILLAALAYMVGNFFSFPQMIGWSKNQLWESLYSMILISTVLIFSIVVHIFPVGVPEALQTNLQISFPEKAAMSIDNVINGKIDLADMSEEFEKEFDEKKVVSTSNFGIRTLFFTTYSYQVVLNVLYNIVSINFLDSNSYTSGSASTTGTSGNSPMGTTETKGNIKFEGQLLTGFQKLMSFSGTISNYLLTLLMILYVQMAALIFIAGGSVFLFMFGVFFRCIPVTRKLGSTLIALFITLYFVYPAFVLFMFSDGMYGEMNREFSGVYMGTESFKGLTDFDPSGIVINTPYGLNYVDSTNFEKDEVKLRFYSNMFTEYNYTITKGFLFNDKLEPNKLISNTNNVLCSGTALNGEIVECDLTKSLPGSYTLFDPNEAFKDEKSIEKSQIIPVNYFIQLEADSTNYDCSSGADCKGISGIATYPEEPLPFPIFFSKPCISERCNQLAATSSSNLESYSSDFVSDYLLSSTVGSSFDATRTGEITADVGMVAAKSLGTVTTQKILKKTAGWAAKQGATGVGAIVGGPPAWILGATKLVLGSIYFKNDISAFTYDSMTCDDYTSTISQGYFGKNVGSREPVFTEDSRSNFFTSLGNFMSGAVDEMYEDTFKYYSKSDYTSCSDSLGMMAFSGGKWVISKIPYLKEFPYLRDFSITVIFAPIVYVFISFIYTLIFCVTFFKSLSESIGGDSSLMGLGKLL